MLSIRKLLIIPKLEMDNETTNNNLATKTSKEKTQHYTIIGYHSYYYWSIAIY